MFAEEKPGIFEPGFCFVDVNCLLGKCIARNHKKILIEKRKCCKWMLNCLHSTVFPSVLPHRAPIYSSLLDEIIKLRTVHSSLKFHTLAIWIGACVYMHVIASAIDCVAERRCFIIDRNLLSRARLNHLAMNRCAKRAEDGTNCTKISQLFSLFTKCGRLRRRKGVTANKEITSLGEQLNDHFFRCRFAVRLIAMAIYPSLRSFSLDAFKLVERQSIAVYAGNIFVRSTFCFRSFYWPPINEKEKAGKLESHKVQLSVQLTHVLSACLISMDAFIYVCFLCVPFHKSIQWAQCVLDLL